VGRGRSIGRGTSSGKKSGSGRKSAAPLTRDNLGFLLAKATQSWNELLLQRFTERGYPEVRPSYGSVIVPLFEEDGLRMTELAQRARLAKQTMTTMVRLVERAGLVERRGDSADGRATCVFLTPRGRDFQPVAADIVSEIDEVIVLRVGRRRVKELRNALGQLSGLSY
jgi:DNA-binding MarR family transcriptional regulator